MSTLTASMLRRRLLPIAAVLIASLGVVAVFTPRDALQAWYAATLLWTGIPLGAMALLMTHHLTSGHWGWYLRPLLGAAVRTLPVTLLAYLPLLAAMNLLFPWTQPAETLPEVVQHKLAYLNAPFFLVRTLVYAIVWLGLAYLLMGRTRTPRPDDRRRGLAAAGLILYALTITFYGVDWVHSLEPEFYSSAIGYVMATGQFVGVLAFGILTAVVLRAGTEPGSREASPPFHDLGNLLLAAVMLWTYIVFMKFLIIWITDLPHEITWYVRRQSGGWYWLTLMLVLLHFCLPLVLLLFRRIKRDPRLLGTVAALLLTAHALHVSWLVLPSFDEHRLFAGLIHVLAVAALGAGWLALFFSRLEAVTHDGSGASRV